MLQNGDQINGPYINRNIHCLSNESEHYNIFDYVSLFMTQIYHAKMKKRENMKFI